MDDDPRIDDQDVIPGLKNGFSRRTFLKGAAAAGALGAFGGIVGCGGKEREAAAPLAATGLASFEEAPEAIPDGKIAKTETADIIVVGAGMSGMCAGISAAQAGAKVILIEKTTTQNFRGYDYGSFGSSLQKKRGDKTDTAEVQLAATRELMRWGGYKSDQNVVQLWAKHSGEAADWLMGMAEKSGCTIEAVPIEAATIPGALFEPFPTLNFRIVPSKEVLKAAPPVFGDIPYTQATSYVLRKNAEEAGVDLRFEMPAAQLVREDGGQGRVSAVIAKGADGAYTKFVGTKGVILATGDYGHNQEMVDKYIPSAKYIAANMYNGDFNTGDGHQMGLWSGAAMDEGPHAPMYFDFAVVDGDGKFLHLADALMRQPWLSVNLRGERFMNEDVPYAYICNSHRQQPGHSKWTVWDSSWKKQAGEFRQIACKDMRTGFHNQENVDKFIADGSIASGKTLDELAGKMGVPADALKATVARYTELAKKGVDEDYGKRATCLTPIEKPPFYAAHLGTCLLVTLGGLQINDKLQVLDAEKNVISGLYAVGNVSGRYYNNDYPVSLTGNSHARAFTFGYLAGKWVAEGTA